MTFFQSKNQHRNVGISPSKPPLLPPTKKSTSPHQTETCPTCHAASTEAGDLSIFEFFRRFLFVSKQVIPWMSWEGFVRINPRNLQQDPRSTDPFSPEYRIARSQLTEQGPLVRSHSTFDGINGDRINWVSCNLLINGIY